MWGYKFLIVIFKKRGGKMDYYLENILKERWLMGEKEPTIQQRLYLFVKNGAYNVLAN